MEKQIITFSANEQILKKTSGQELFADDVVGYIEAHFDLGDNWSGYDSIRAVWFTAFAQISTVLDQNGVCLVPPEVCNRKEAVNVNLVGSIADGDELTDRLTTYPIVAFIFDGNARVDGSETAPITPSQFEQYVAIVEALVGSVKDIDHATLNADYTLTIYYSDGTSDTVGPIRGEQGPIGPTGNGIASIAKTGTSGTNPVVDTYTITYTNGQTTTFTVTNGVKGDTGNGIQSIYLTGQSGAVKIYTILMTDGSTFQFDVTDGEVTEAVLDEATIVQTLSDDEPYLFRRTNNGNGSGKKERLNSIVGVSVGWNQICQNGNFADASGWGSVKQSGTETGALSVSDGVMSVEAIATGVGQGITRDFGRVFETGHVYLNSLYAKADSVGHNFSTALNGQTVTSNRMISGQPLTTSFAFYAGITKFTPVAQYDVDRYLRISISSSTSMPVGEKMYLKEVQLNDLTAMLGATIADFIYTLEQSVTGSGVAFYKKYFGDKFSPFDSGSIKSVAGLTSHDTVGFNQFNGTWENGYINASTGVFVPNTAYSTTDYIPLIPGQKYYCKATVINADTPNTAIYDADKNYIGMPSSPNAVRFNNTFTARADAHYMRVVLTNANVSRDNFCINLHGDGSRNGEYEPYELHSYPLDSDLELRGIPKLDASNNLYYDGDTYEADGTVTRKYGVVDLGTLSWNVDSGHFYSTGISSLARKPSANSVVANAICSRYPVLKAYDASPDDSWDTDKSMAINSTGYVYIHDTAYSTAAALKTSLDGVYLVYELATLTTDSADPYQATQFCDPSGTEKFVIDNGAFPIPVGHDTEYPMTLIDTMPKANGSYTMHLTVANGKRTISWT